MIILDGLWNIKVHIGWLEPLYGFLKAAIHFDPISAQQRGRSPAKRPSSDVPRFTHFDQLDKKKLPLGSVGAFDI